MKKKLQVFISSTFEDLRKERQKATEGILISGHIPAGMELFVPSDRSQLDIIERWIKESDLLVVIIGGRYGSVHPTLLKSYTQLEVEFAKENNIPVFAIKLTEQYLATKKSQKISEIVYECETDDPKINEFEAFKNTFTEVYVARVDSIELISHQINLGLQKFIDEDDEQYHFRGWVRPDMPQKLDAGIKDSETRVNALDISFRKDIIIKIEEGFFIDKMHLILDNCSFRLDELKFIDDFIFWSSKPSNIFYNEDLQNLLFQLRRSFQEYRQYLSLNFFPSNGRQHFYPDLNIDLDGVDYEDQKKFEGLVSTFIKVTNKTVDEIKFFIRQSQIELISQKL